MDTIKWPWLIVHQPAGPGTALETMLAGEPGVQYQDFSLLIADTVRHVAKAFNVDEHDVMRLVEKELANPTTPLLGGKVS